MRTRRGLPEEPDSIEPARQSQTWLRAESSEALAGINEECLELLTAQSMVRTLQPQPMLCELADLWRSLDARARRRAAECPYLLVDAGFADAPTLEIPQRTCRERIGCERGRGAAVLHDAGLERRDSSSSAVCSRAWRAPTMWLHDCGWRCPAHCTQLLAGYTLRDIDTAAARHPAWLRPRWSATYPFGVSSLRRQDQGKWPQSSPRACMVFSFSPGNFSWRRERDH